MVCDLELLNRLKVGIVGCGHLGQAIAQSLIAHGLAKENLLISYRGNPLTYQKLEAKGLAPCLADNKRLFAEAGIILVITKPNDIPEFEGSFASDRSMIVSCMAGVPVELLNGIFKKEVYRMMFSGPDTISSEKGVAAAYPRHEYLEHLTSVLNLKYIQIDAEKDMDTFTAGVCLPAALLKLNNPDACSEAIGRVKTEFPLLSELYTWAASAVPDFRDNTETEQYIEKMTTKGGITEAIINSIQNGVTLDAALIMGIARTKEISFEIQRAIKSCEKK
ncbi:MAG: NAD(P)-binding domain-containing protein [Oscillospiraceae bacterium]